MIARSLNTVSECMLLKGKTCIHHSSACAVANIFDSMLAFVSPPRRRRMAWATLAGKCHHRARIDTITHARSGAGSTHQRIGCQKKEDVDACMDVSSLQLMIDANVSRIEMQRLEGIRHNHCSSAMSNGRGIATMHFVIVHDGRTHV